MLEVSKTARRQARVTQRLVCVKAKLGTFNKTRLMSDWQDVSSSTVHSRIDLHAPRARYLIGLLFGSHHLQRLKGMIV